MTKQEEIREGIAETLYTFEYDGWEKLSAGGRVMWLARADAIMNKEHSQGVVIKVDRKLPAFITLDGISGMELVEATRQSMLKAGYAAWEPLKSRI